MTLLSSDLQQVVGISQAMLLLTILMCDIGVIACRFTFLAGGPSMDPSRLLAGSPV